MSDPYAEVAALAERELELARAGELTELAATQARREALVAALPSVPPPAAAPALRRAAAAQRAVTEALTASLADTAAELRTLERGRGAVRGYGLAAVPAGFDRAA